MSFAGLTIFLDRLSTKKTDTVLFFLVLSYLLQIEHKAMLLYFTGDGLCSLEQVVDIDLYFRGGCPTIFIFIPPFWGGNFSSFSGEGNFGGVFFLFGQGKGHFSG